jgi:hypothetical protein
VICTEDRVIASAMLRIQPFNEVPGIAGLPPV